MKSALAAGILGLTVIAPGAIGAHVQPGPPATFEVASIRRSDSLNSSGSLGVRPGGTFIARNVGARGLIGSAYSVPNNRVLETPPWADEERYVIEALAEGLSSLVQARPLLLALLRDRFKLEARRETRELPVYLLQLARSDGALGPRVRKNDLDCQNPEARAKAAAAAAPGREVCLMTFDAGRLTGSVMRIEDLVPILTGASGRPVLNRTGVAGFYDIDLEWAQTPDVPDAVSIFTAVQEQLGMRLESVTAPLEVVVVDRLERPTEN